MIDWPNGARAAGAVLVVAPRLQLPPPNRRLPRQPPQPAHGGVAGDGGAAPIRPTINGIIAMAIRKFGRVVHAEIARIRGRVRKNKHFSVEATALIVAVALISSLTGILTNIAIGAYVVIATASMAIILVTRKTTAVTLFGSLLAGALTLLFLWGWEPSPGATEHVVSPRRLLTSVAVGGFILGVLAGCSRVYPKLPDRAAFDEALASCVLIGLGLGFLNVFAGGTLVESSSGTSNTTFATAFVASVFFLSVRAGGGDDYHDTQMGAVAPHEETCGAIIAPPA
jgi:hypothetical protein